MGLHAPALREGRSPKVERSGGSDGRISRVSKASAGTDDRQLVQEAEPYLIRTGENAALGVSIPSPSDLIASVGWRVVEYKPFNCLRDRFVVCPFVVSSDLIKLLVQLDRD